MPTADYQTRVDRILEAVDEHDDIAPENADLLTDYQRDKQIDGMSFATQQRNLSYLKQLAKQAGPQSFINMDTGDVKDLLQWVVSRDLSEETVDTYKKAMRSFWTWMHDGETPDAIAFVSISNNGGEKLPQDLLTPEDIDRLLSATKNPRDKAFIALLWETGARIGELIDLTVGDIEDHERRGGEVVINGKTGSRRLRLIESWQPLAAWLNQHPNGAGDAPLWCKIQQGTGYDQLSYNYLRQKVLQRNMDRAGIDKPSNPHHFRHSRATFLATKLTEAQLCQRMGWVMGSDVPQKYVHLSGRDLDADYEAMYGIEPEEEDNGPEIAECDRCGEVNDPKAIFCMRCGYNMDPERATEVDTVMNQKAKESYKETDPGTQEQADVEAYEEVLEEPDVKEAIAQALVKQQADD